MPNSMMRLPGGPIEIVPANEHFSRLSVGYIYLGPQDEPDPRRPADDKHTYGRASTRRRKAIKDTQNEPV